MASLAGETYAHSVAGRPQDAWQTLDTHAANVAERVHLFPYSSPLGSLWSVVRVNATKNGS